MQILTQSGNIYYYDRCTNRLEQMECASVNVVNKFKVAHSLPTPSFTRFCIELTRQCNFRCVYCCFSGEYEGRRMHRHQSQSYQNLNDIISFIGRTTKSDGEVSVSFYGGESLLEFDKIKYVVKKLITLFKHRIKFAISTNGYLLTKDIVNWVCSIPRMTIAITIDGDEAMHNKNRVLANGHATHEKIMENLRYFHDNHPKDFEERVELLATIEKTTDLLQLNEAWMRTPLLKDKLPVHVSTLLLNFNKTLPHSPLEEKIRTFYVALEHYKQGTTNLLTNELLKLTNSIKEREIYRQSSEELTIKSCLNEIDQCFIDCDGKIAPCERLCDTFRIGNIHNGVDEELRLDYVRKFEALLNSRCKDCWAQRLCKICPKQLEHNNQELDYLCQKEKELAYLSLLMYCEIVEFHCIELKD